MNAADISTIKSRELTVTDQPIYLWLKQSFRKLLGKPPLQDEVLDRVVAQVITDKNLLGILLFGSVASRTHSWKSDIDLIFVYKNCELSSGVTNFIVDGIVVQYFFTAHETLVQNQETVPYLLHMFCDAKILFDRHGSISQAVDQLKGYFAAHPEVEDEWIRFKDLHQVEKKEPACAQTTIFQRWDELEDKYSGGVRKRTFFLL